MKKIISFLVALTFIFASVSVAFAKEGNNKGKNSKALAQKLKNATKELNKALAERQKFIDKLKKEAAKVEEKKNEETKNINEKIEKVNEKYNEKVKKINEEIAKLNDLVANKDAKYAEIVKSIDDKLSEKITEIDNKIAQTTDDTKKAAYEKQKELLVKIADKRKLIEKNRIDKIAEIAPLKIEVLNKELTIAELEKNAEIDYLNGLNEIGTIESELKTYTDQTKETTATGLDKSIEVRYSGKLKELDRKIEKIQALVNELKAQLGNN